ncbi:MAG: bifunctional phosphoglucose/phosphomannose isomerase [Thermoplasmataceae archaeon]
MEFYEQILSLKEQFKTSDKFQLPGNFKNMVISGMGGSGIAGKIFQDLYNEKLLFVNESYDIPRWVDQYTLFIGISYSGNTEETLAALEAAIKAGAQTVSISSGGKISRMASTNVVVPGGLQPRSALGYLVSPLLNTFNIINSAGKERVYELLDELDKEHKFLDLVASEIVEDEKIPVLLTLPGFRSAGFRWKTQFNENAKILSFSLNFPELDHNDIMAFERSYLRERFYPIVIGDTTNSQMEKRISATSNLTGYKFKLLPVKGKNPVEKIMYAIHCADYVSYHASILRGLDPEDVSVIEKLKSELVK